MRKLQRKHPWWSVFVFLELSLNFLEQTFSRTLPVPNSLRSFGWMTVIYFFFGQLFVFWVFFTLVRVTFEFLAIHVEKTLPWRLQTRLFFCFHWKKMFLCFVGSYYWDNIQFNQSMNFLKIVIKTYLIQDPSLQYLTK